MQQTHTMYIYIVIIAPPNLIFLIISAYTNCSNTHAHTHTHATISGQIKLSFINLMALIFIRYICIRSTAELSTGALCTLLQPLSLSHCSAWSLGFSIYRIAAGNSELVWYITLVCFHFHMLQGVLLKKDFSSFPNDTFSIQCLARIESMLDRGFSLRNAAPYMQHEKKTLPLMYLLNIRYFGSFVTSLQRFFLCVRSLYNNRLTFDWFNVFLWTDLSVQTLFTIHWMFYVIFTTRLHLITILPHESVWASHLNSICWWHLLIQSV